jgi:triacylglycerol esterase/lipase EstA (alpha/beta hydrolase family)
MSSTRLGQQCGCVLVGHSFGGLVIKSLVVEARKRGLYGVTNRLDENDVVFANRFLQNLRGVVNYAVPHRGSFLESYFTLGHKLYRQVKLAGFMKHLKPFSRQMEDLSTMFDAISHEKSILVLAFLEGKPLKDVVSNDFLC